jgi:hypothetical protein
MVILEVTQVVNRDQLVICMIQGTHDSPMSLTSTCATTHGAPNFIHNLKESTGTVRIEIPKTRSNMRRLRIHIVIRVAIAQILS